MSPLRSSLSRSATKLLGVFKERDLSLRGVTQSLRTPPFSATGGTEILNGGYTYHVFVSPGNLVTTGIKQVEVFLVGGAGGGTGFGGGGGGGGIFNDTNYTLSYGTHPVVVGGGGGVGVYPHPSESNAGENSSIDSTVSYGGGGGTYLYGGGSGGRGTFPPGQVGYNYPGPSQQGYPGGNGFSASGSDDQGGGGGGAGQAGGNASSRQGGVGGNGAPFPAYAAPIIAPALTTAGVPAPEVSAFTSECGPTGLYGGGGGGGTRYDSQPNTGPAPGGTGGGGDAGGSLLPGTPGINYCGGGGAASGANNPAPDPTSVGVGGKGIVIIRYLV